MQTQINHKRLTISIPPKLNDEINLIQKDMKISRSELFKNAIEDYTKKYKKKKLQMIAEMMKSEYGKNEELTAFTVLDSEDFK